MMAPGEPARQIPLDDQNADPNELELAWGAEIEKRLRDRRGGKVVSIPSEEVFAKLDDILDES